MSASFTAAIADLQKAKSALTQAIYGKDEVLELALSCLLAQGHLLLEDVPGVGKTTLAIAMAHTMGGSQQRIQFTSDLLPSDVIGVMVFNQAAQRFDFRPGPLFANIVLADEINRTTPKTQSCLLEAMQDGKVTVDRQVHALPTPFMVIATQNPIEHHGTYPLPESQLDRFMMRLSLGYPDPAAELRILQNLGKAEHQPASHAVLSLTRLQELQQLCHDVRISTSLLEYMLQIITATRDTAMFDLGVSTRGSLMLQRSVKAYAMLQGRDYCTPDDIKKLAHPVLAHRLLVKASFQTPAMAAESHRSAELLLDKILSRIEVPR